MNSPAAKPSLLPSEMSAPTPRQALQRLFLTLFLRGRGARGLNPNAAPKSVSQKLTLTLLIYLLVGCVALTMMRQPVFALAVYLHALTFAFLGMFVASSAGEILFNKEEADILLHRPIDPRTMLWSKIRVLVEVSLWLAGAFNLAGFFAGLGCPDGGWRFPIAHVVSTTMEALFCTGCVVLIYQLCLRWFGRERLEGLMTLTQVLVSVGAVLASQILPRVIFRLDHVLTAKESSWWMGLLPPAWFAGFDDAFSGSGASTSWIFAAMAMVVTGVVLWLAFNKLAHNYETGIQSLNEAVSKRKRNRQSRRWIDWLVTVPPLSWWSRDPISRASFLLTTAYLIRDRDVKLRVYPSIAPMLVFPFIFLFQKGSEGSDFGIAFSGGYLGLIPLLALNILQYSQQWQASDIFRAAPMRGPAAICNGARRAVLIFLTLPMLLVIGAIIWLLHGVNSHFLLLLPGIIALPVYAAVPGLIGKAIPLSAPIEEAKAAGRGTVMILVMMISMALSGLASWSWSQGWFWELLIGETIIVIGLYTGMRLALANVRWQSAE
jgi:ABC-2 type transport system permease protein